MLFPPDNAQKPKSRSSFNILLSAARDTKEYCYTRLSLLSPYGIILTIRHYGRIKTSNNTVQQNWQLSLQSLCFMRSFSWTLKSYFIKPLEVYKPLEFQNSKLNFIN